MFPCPQMKRPHWQIAHGLLSIRRKAIQTWLHLAIKVMLMRLPAFLMASTSFRSLLLDTKLTASISRLPVA